MLIKSIKLINFRNYTDCKFQFTTPITVLMGDNAQGKSNFLESIYFLATSKSPKAEKDEELIKKGEEVLRVEGEVDETTLEIAMQSSEQGFRKRVRVNGVGRRVLDYIGHLSVVSFTPEDINLVTGPPALRRWHIDLTIAQVDKSYKVALTNYGEVIIRKNRLLKMVKSGEARVEELSFWIKQQLELGKVVSDKRRAFFEFLNSSEKSLGQFKFNYQESVLSEERLSQHQEREIAAANSLIGPHRDDFRFVIVDKPVIASEAKQSQSEEIATSPAAPRNDVQGRDLAHFGSRGEHRTAVLDLKLTEALFFETVLGDRPILLLDDVFSELDSSHKQHVLSLVSLQQTIIATVDLDEETKKGLKGANFFSVASGQLNETADK